MENKPNDPWDIVTIGGERLPGKATPRVSCGFIPGNNRAYIPGEINIELLPSSEDDYRFFCRVIWPMLRLGKPLSIQHPGLSFWKISSIVVEAIEVRRAPGPTTVRIKAIEFIGP